MSDVTVKINGIEVQVPAGTNMVEAAAKVGIEIPHFCYHAHLPIAGNCRMCMVDIEAGGRGPDIACNMGARDGLAIRTDTDNVKYLRKSQMEFLLKNHPLDCPICDQSGECRLQDYYMAHAGHHSRLADTKSHKHKNQDIGTNLVLDAERCIACTRCVRFGDNITHTGELRIFNRTDHVEIGIFPGERIEHHYQGSLAEICPVGALTRKDFRFQKRVWYLKETDGICGGCATGCNMTVHHQDGNVFRFTARRNDDVNQSWMCDPGRGLAERLRELTRLLRAQVNGRKVSFEVALQTLADNLVRITGEHGEAAMGVVLGCGAGNEANYAMVKLAREHFPGFRLFWCEGNDPGAIDVSDDFLMDPDKNPNTMGVKVLVDWDGNVGDRDALRAALDNQELKGLIVLEDDIVTRLGGHQLQGLELLTYVGTFANATVARANILLPSASNVEQHATVINRKGRVQRMRQAVQPAGDSTPAYRSVQLLAEALGKEVGTALAASTFAKMAAEVPALAGMTYEKLGRGGMDIVRPAEESTPVPDPAGDQPTA